MKKKLLSCILAVVMITGLFTCRLSAESGDITVDVSNPVSNPSGLTISDGAVTFASKEQYVEYEIDAEKAGSYYINFNRSNLGSGSFYIFAEVNGETVNRRTGRITNPDGSYTFQDEVQLEQGKNIIKIGNMSNYAGVLTGLSLSKTDTVQYTTSMNTYPGGRTFKAAYKSGLGVDPWLWINDSVSSYPDGENAPYITFEVNILKSGFYYPAVATSGANKVKLAVAGQVFPVNDNCTILAEKYKASGSGTCSWLKNNDAVYMQEGTHDVTISLYGAIAAKWNAYIGAVRFIAMEESNPTDETVYIGDFALDITKPARCSGAEAVDGKLSMSSGNWAEYDVYVSENASYYVNFKRQDDVSDKQFYIQVSANGKTVNRRTGRAGNADGSYTFQSEIQLKKGKNTIRVETMGLNSGTVSELSFSKLEKVQFTTSMNSTSGGRTFKKAYKSGAIGVDPWMYINEPVSSYTPGNAPFVTFDVEILYDGFYYPEIAKGSGGSYFKMYVDGQSIDMNRNTADLDGQFISSGSVACKWKRSNNAVYLTKGTHEITLKLVGGSNQSEATWRLSVGAIRFTEAVGQHLTFTIEGEDAKIYSGSEMTPAELDTDEFSIYQAEPDSTPEMSGAAVLAVHVPTSNQQVTFKFDAVITNDCEYNFDILWAHDADLYPEGKLSIASDDGEIISDTALNDDNVTVIESNYLKCSALGGAELDVVRLNQPVHMPKGKNTITLTFDLDDFGAEHDMADLILDAFKLTEIVDVSDITAYALENKVCIGDKTKVKFENGRGLPVYPEKFNNVDFSSSDENIAVVNNEGIIRGVRPGNAVITVNADGMMFYLPVSTTANNGLVIKTAVLDSDGNIEIIYSADMFSEFDIVAASYDIVNGKKTSIRGMVIKPVFVDDEEEKSITIEKTEFAGDLGQLFEIYFWDSEDNLNGVYQKIQLQ